MEAILNISIGKGLGAVNILLLPCCRPLLFLLLCANTSFFGILTIWLHHWPFYQVTLLFQEKAMATHPSTLSWKIPHTRRSLVGCSHGVAKSWTWLSDFTFTFHFPALEKEMATHSIVLAWWIPGMGEPGGLPSMGSHRVGHDWSNLAAAAANTYMTVSSRSLDQNFSWKCLLHPRLRVGGENLVISLWVIYDHFIFTFFSQRHTKCLVT